jgi:hypothetical protein
MIYPLYPLNLRCFALAPAWDPRIPGRGVADHRRHESPHKGHAQLLRQARERLEGAGYQVPAAGWITGG